MSEAISGVSCAGRAVPDVASLIRATRADHRGAWKKTRGVHECALSPCGRGRVRKVGKLGRVSGMPPRASFAERYPSPNRVRGRDGDALSYKGRGRCIAQRDESMGCAKRRRRRANNVTRPGGGGHDSAASPAVEHDPLIRARGVVGRSAPSLLPMARRTVMAAPSDLSAATPAEGPVTASAAPAMTMAMTASHLDEIRSAAIDLKGSAGQRAGRHDQRG